MRGWYDCGNTFTATFVPYSCRIVSNTRCDSITASPVIGITGENPRWPFVAGEKFERAPIENVSSVGTPKSCASRKPRIRSSASGNL